MLKALDISENELYVTRNPCIDAIYRVYTLFFGEVYYLITRRSGTQPGDGIVFIDC